MKVGKSSRPKVFVVAGEASADLFAAALVRELESLTPISVYGVGGKACREAGMQIVLDASSLNVVGMTDWIDRVGEIFSAYRRVVKLLTQDPPDCAVLLDLPDFNLLLARRLRRLGVPVVYYISPQVWAWRKYRVRKIRAWVDKMLVVFPFEKDFYSKNGVEVEFVGHPLLETIETRDQFRSSRAILEAPRIAILPGSRKSELKYHSPVLTEVIGQLKERYPKGEFRIPVASTLCREAVREAMRLPSAELSEGNSLQVLRWADIALVASGTATLETALVGTPFALFYRVSRSSAWLFRHILRYRGFLGMPNLLLGRPAIREFFQDDFTASHLVKEAIQLIENAEYREEMKRELGQCRSKLGRPGASARAAASVWRVLKTGGGQRGRVRREAAVQPA